MITSTKGKSPFYPGQPVPVELFVGRAEQLDRIITRGVGQVAEGKPITVYVQGEYGIGKSSVAKFVQWMAERNYNLHPIYASIGGVRNLEDLAAAVLEATVRSGALDPKKWEKIGEFLAKYIGKIDLYGVNINFDALKKDASNFKTPFSMLSFLSETLKRLQKDTEVNGIFLVLDEINGIASNPDFAYFIKSLVDTNAMSAESLPLLLMLCGVEECRREMIQNHQPVERIFDVVDIEPMSKKEMEAFFKKAFDSVNVRVNPEALTVMTYYSAGFPKIMHLIGDSAFWLDQDGEISKDEATFAVLSAADEVGKKYVDQQVFKALRSKDYHSILGKIAKTGLGMTFLRQDVTKGLTNSERKKFDNFLQRMKKLKVLRSGEVKGEYVFNSRMVRVYIWLTLGKPSKA